MMRRRRMTSVALNSNLDLQLSRDRHQHGILTEEIDGLIKVYRDGRVERPQIVPCVSTSVAPVLGVASDDRVIDKFTNIWARLYVPITCQGNNNDNYNKLPTIVYFHGGGFCVGSAAWSCYHEFLCRLASMANCLIMSVNYRLAPENPLPAAYEDGIKSLMWLKQQTQCANSDITGWSRYCDFSNIFLAGDSAGANIAYNIVSMLSCKNSREELVMNPLNIKGTILIQPFFGGDVRTQSEKCLVQSARSALSLVASDTYWRLALPRGANRDHPFCNPLGKGSMRLGDLEPNNNFLVCISEMDILRDRNLEFVGALGRAGKRVEHVVFEGVGHAFQVLSKSQVSLSRTLQMMSQIKAFISG